MNKSENDAEGGAGEAERRQLPKRRLPGSDRRNADRVVTEPAPRRQNPERRKSED